MLSSQRIIVGLLVVIAFLLGWIGATSLASSEAGSLPAGFLPAAQAAPIPLNVDRDYFVTSSVDGATIYVWRLGPMVNGHYESATARAFYAPGGRN